MAEQRNVVLICLDTVRKDYFDRFATRLSKEANLTFEQCRAASCWSAPSHASMFTGKLPSEHGVHSPYPDFFELKREDTFFGNLPDHTALGVTANVWASSLYGFDQFFDELLDISPHRRFPKGMDVEEFYYDCDKTGIHRYVEFLRRALGHEYPLETLLNGASVQVENLLEQVPIPKLTDDGASIVSKAALRIISSHVRNSNDPFVMFTNFMDAHSPHTPLRVYDKSLYSAPPTWSSDEFNTTRANTFALTREFDKRRSIVSEADEKYERELYGASIEYLDRAIMEFVRSVQEMTERETTFVITADHGENLGTEVDRHLFGHVGALSEGLLHVPLSVINAPESDTVRQYTSHLQLGTLISSLATGVVPDISLSHVPAEVIGSSVVRGSSHDFSEEEKQLWNRMIRCVYDTDMKFEWDSINTRTSYQLDSSKPNWEQSVDTEFPDDINTQFFPESITSVKQRSEKKTSGDRSMTEATERRLRDLGYL